MSDHLSPQPQSEPGDQWAALKAFTPARIALGRVGAAIPIREVLAFKLAHAQARDAVHARLDTTTLSRTLSTLGLKMLGLHSRAASRGEYLQRPDWGRRLDDTSAEFLREVGSANPAGYDLVIVIADGLSALAVECNAVPLLEAFLPMIEELKLKLGPVAIVEQGRVAIGDEIGFLLHAKITAVLIGERPGLSSPDSLGIYLTYGPEIGLNNNRRNCISNIRAGGLSPSLAAQKWRYLLEQSLALHTSGITLKDEMPA